MGLAYYTEILARAEPLAEWDHNGLRYKAFRVPRSVIDAASEAPPALMVIGLDGGYVCKYEGFFDPEEYDRLHTIPGLARVMLTCPDEVSRFALEIGILRERKRSPEEKRKMREFCKMWLDSSREGET